MLERKDKPLLQTEPDPPLPETQPKPRPTPPIWRQLKLNKNLCNYPVAQHGQNALYSVIAASTAAVPTARPTRSTAKAAESGDH
jgi:hypothetical protein